VITVPVVDVLPAADEAAAEAGALPDAAPAAVALVVDPPPLLQAATISAAASGTPSLTGPGMRASHELLIFIVSLSAVVGYRSGYGPDAEKARSNVRDVHHIFSRELVYATVADHEH
jgi:hypothetical protein